jgi:hypothetical protein
MESPRILFISKYREKETHILKLITATLVGLGIEQQAASGSRHIIKYEVILI